MNYITALGATLEERMEQLIRDLTDKGGPRISIMKNFPYALFHYKPEEEMQMRKCLQKRISLLKNNNWTVGHISLLELFLKMLKDSGDFEDLVEAEQEMYKESGNDSTASLNAIQEMLTPYFAIHNEEGYGQAVVDAVNDIAGEDDKKSVVFLTRAGSLYPFYRVSALLKYIDGQTKVPVILLYPGVRKARNTLSFMGEIEANTDYRPRIY